MPYIFCDSKCLINNVLQKRVKMVYFPDFLCFSCFCINIRRTNVCCRTRYVAEGEDNVRAFLVPKGSKEGSVVLFAFWGLQYYVVLVFRYAFSYFGRHGYGIVLCGRETDKRCAACAYHASRFGVHCLLRNGYAFCSNACHGCVDFNLVAVEHGMNEVGIYIYRYGERVALCEFAQHGVEIFGLCHVVD